jgi:hypothetical protein
VNDANQAAEGGAQGSQYSGGQHYQKNKNFQNYQGGHYGGQNNYYGGGGGYNRHHNYQSQA